MSVGIDIVEIKRISFLLEKHKSKFMIKFFTNSEVNYIRKRKNNPQTIAGMFSAKEAVSKLLGVGFNGLKFHDIQILHDDNSKPCVYINTSNVKIQKYLQHNRIEISVSHCKEYATAIAVAYPKKCNATVQ